MNRKLTSRRLPEEGTLENALSFYLKNPSDAKLFYRESLAFDLSEHLYKRMKQKKITAEQLAKLLKKSKLYIQRMLDGRSETTLNEIADIFSCLGFQITFRCKPKQT